MRLHNNAARVTSYTAGTSSEQWSGHCFFESGSSHYNTPWINAERPSTLSEANSDEFASQIAAKDLFSFYSPNKQAP